MVMGLTFQWRGASNNPGWSLMRRRRRQDRGGERRGEEGRIGDGMEWRNLGLFSIDDNWFNYYQGYSKSPKIGIQYSILMTSCEEHLYNCFKKTSNLYLLNFDSMLWKSLQTKTLVDFMLADLTGLLKLKR